MDFARHFFSDHWLGTSGREYRRQYHESFSWNLRLDCRDSFHHKSLALVFLEKQPPIWRLFCLNGIMLSHFVIFARSSLCPAIQNGPPSNARKARRIRSALPSSHASPTRL